MKIGTFSHNEATNTYAGEIKTLTVTANVQLKPNTEKAKDNAPDYRVEMNGTEVGAAWNKTSEDGRPYTQITLDDPFLPAKIYANLINGVLHWSRLKPGKKKEK